MVHQGGVTSKTSRALANVRQQLKTKKTRGRNPRDLTDNEVTLLRNKQDSLLCQLKANAVDRAEGQRRRQRDLKAKAKLLHERLQRALQNNARVEQDLRLATEAQDWLSEHLCQTVIDQVNSSIREEPTIMVYLLIKNRSQPDRTHISVDDIKTFRKKMYVFLHPDKNKQPGASAAFVKFRRATDDLLARLTRMPLYPYRPTADPALYQRTLQLQLAEREALQETVSSLVRRGRMAAEELRDAEAAWSAAQDALPASARNTRPVVCADSSPRGSCHRCGAAPPKHFWCGTCSSWLRQKAHKHA